MSRKFVVTTGTILASVLDNQGIAQKLVLIEKRVSNIILKVQPELGLRSRVELCRYYLGFNPVVKFPDPG